MDGFTRGELVALLGAACAATGASGPLGLLTSPVLADQWPDVVNAARKCFDALQRD